MDFRTIQRFPDKCRAEVSRKGELGPCDKTAYAVALDDGRAWPVCIHHARGRALVSLTDLLDNVGMLIP